MSKTITDLYNDIVQVAQALQSPKRRAQIASNEETDARNRLNNAQKAFAAAVAEMRKQAPRDSDWAHKPRMPA